MDLDKLSKPCLTEAIAIDLVRTIYGFEVVDIKSMISFNDQNFRIQVSKKHQNPHINNISEDGYTLKIINTFKSSLEGHIDSIHSALNHLSKKGLRVPVPVRNLEGNTWKLETVPLLNEGSRMPRFLHGDFNDLNILAREKSPEPNNRIFVIDVILDFEDMHYGNYVWDIGLMLTHVLMGQHDFGCSRGSWTCISWLFES
ncbi:hydroxylysine kinase [Trichonephila inaurata madagascariensis]|uniref:Hydroxylysine kinase n=1 Tax=Trichonephila inaurata madagascariensis TaxID=2747483 RepID=A0A8X6Y2A4_9ARAC|nr:hydroxylysine kinase [Trichonephila inaurata madagascariensis]